MGRSSSPVKLNSKNLPPENAFIMALVQRQGTTSSREFAKTIKVSEALWRGTRNGRFALGLKLFAAGRDLVGYDIASPASAALATRAATSYGPRKPKAEKKEKAA